MVCGVFVFFRFEDVGFFDDVRFPGDELDSMYGVIVDKDAGAEVIRKSLVVLVTFCTWVVVQGMNG